MFGLQVLRNELAQNIVRRIRGDTSIEVIMQQEMHGPEIWKVNTLVTIAHFGLHEGA